MRNLHSRLCGPLCALALLALAQGPAAAADPVAVAPAGLAGVQTFGAVPDDFDPETASDREIDRLGLPPRPDRKTDPAGYAAWVRDVSPDIRRSLSRTDRTRAITSPQPSQDRTSNWSGFVFQRPIEKYGRKSFRSIHATWSIPAVQPPLGTCETTPNSGNYEIGIWPGLGGSGNDRTILQAGTAARTSCVGGEVTADHWAWYEFYPNPPVTIETVPALPGHVVSVYVWSSSPRVGHAHVVNRTTQESASFKLTFDDADNRLIGSSAEWIVERPGDGDGFATLPNYTEVVMYEATAKTRDGIDVDLGGDYKNHRITRTRKAMVFDPGPGKKISIAEIIGERAVRFRARGPAKRQP